jgi:uncharacterized membrane protein
MTEIDKDDANRAVPPKPLIISNHGLVLTVYVLYLVGFVTGITVLIGLIIAYLQRDRTDQICQTHFQFQIRTFWLGLLYLFVGALMIHFAVGLLILIWWVIWTLIRCVKGLLALNAGEPIRDPNSLWFG